MCVYTNIYIHIYENYTCACVWIFLYTYIHIDWIHKYLFINEYIDVICICMYTYRHIHIHVCIIIYVHMSVYFCTVQLLSCVWLFATPWTTARPLDYSSAITGWNIAICDNLDRSWDISLREVHQKKTNTVWFRIYMEPKTQNSQIHRSMVLEGKCGRGLHKWVKGVKSYKFPVM